MDPSLRGEAEAIQKKVFFGLDCFGPIGPRNDGTPKIDTLCV